MSITNPPAFSVDRLCAHPYTYLDALSGGFVTKKLLFLSKNRKKTANKTQIDRYCYKFEDVKWLDLNYNLADLLFENISPLPHTDNNSPKT